MDYLDYVISKTTNQHLLDPGVQEMIRCLKNQNTELTKKLTQSESREGQLVEENMRLRCKLVKGAYTK